MGRCSAPCVTGKPQDALTIAGNVLSGMIDDAVSAAMQNLTAMASREEFERAAEERDRLSAIISTASRKEQLSLLSTIPELRAARRGDRGWEIIVVRWGRLAGSALAKTSSEVVGISEALAETTPAVDEPDSACGAAPVEEMEILYDWICSSGTRLLSSPDTPFAVSRRSPQRFKLSIER